MMKNYHLESAFEDVSRAVIASGEPMDYDTRFRAAVVLHAFARASYTAGMPDGFELWPAHPAGSIVAAMRLAGPAREIDYGVAEASPWALRECAGETFAATTVNDHRDEEFNHHINLCRDQAEQIEDSAHDGLSIEDADDLTEYDARLREHAARS